MVFVIILIISSVFSFLLGICFSVRKSLGVFEKQKQMSNKHLVLYRFMSDWVKIKKNGYSFEEYLKKRGYNSVAIYGMSYVGECLYNELIGTEINVLYAIDKNAYLNYEGLKIVNPNEQLEKVDAIIVTPISSYIQIKNQLKARTNIPIISIEEIVYNI